MPQIERAGERPATATIALRQGQYDKFCALKGWHTLTDKAHATGMDKGAVSRMLAGKRPLNVDFIAKTLTAFPELEFTDLFEVVSDDVEDAVA